MKVAVAIFVINKQMIIYLTSISDENKKRFFFAISRCYVAGDVII